MRDVFDLCIEPEMFFERKVTGVITHVMSDLRRSRIIGHICVLSVSRHGRIEELEENQDDSPSGKGKSEYADWIVRRRQYVDLDESSCRSRVTHELL